MESRVETLGKQCAQLFQKRGSLLSLWQSIADNFYPERAEFTTTRTLGSEFCEGLYSSIPILMRRELGNNFSAMLRPTSKPWFETAVAYDEGLNNGSKKWLEMATKTQRRAMYDRVTNFVRATKEGDHDFATFGQAVMSVRLNKDRSALLYRCWNLRDVAWAENDEGRIDTIYRRWKATARDIMRLFPKTIPANIKEAYDKDPFAEFVVIHANVPSECYEIPGKKMRKGLDTASVYFTEDGCHLLEEVYVHDTEYVIPRWQTVSGSQYAYSPATIVTLPDARLIQSMAGVLLEAGEKAVNPPMIAAQQAIRSDVSIYAGGITWVDAEYDERLGEALRPLPMDKSGIPTGLQMNDRVAQTLGQGFFRDKLMLPPVQQGVTAFEFNQRISEYIRQSLPLFEPMEVEYNGAICEKTFDLLMRNGAFGPPDEIPSQLRGNEVRFKFKSPLIDAEDAQKGTILQQAKSLLAQTIDLDPSTRHIIDAKVALRDALNGINVPAKWLADEDIVEKLSGQDAQAAAEQQALAAISQGSEVAKNFAPAIAASQSAQRAP